jgi:hypothetical protein
MMNTFSPTKSEISARAFELYVQRGRQPGHELDDWLQAEFELRHLPFHVERLESIAAHRKLSRRQRPRLSMRFSKH